MESDTLVSIITVSYNAEKYIRRTIESVLKQKYKNIEYIIVDGKSSDSTVNIVNEYKSKCNTYFKIISEKDNGIYDAMNKGITLASGEVIYFLNAGDLLFDDNVVYNVVLFFKNNICDVLYGDIALSYKKEMKIKNNTKLNNRFFLKGNVICHQCIFSKKDVFSKTGYFNTNYRITADRDWLLRAFKLKLKISHISQVIAAYDMYGFSSSDETLLQMRSEYENIILNQYGFVWYLLKHYAGNFKRKISTKFYK